MRGTLRVDKQRNNIDNDKITKNKCVKNIVPSLLIRLHRGMEDKEYNKKNFSYNIK